MSFNKLTFESQSVRMTEIDGVPHWVAMDICKVLGIKNQRDAVSRLCDDEKDGVAFTDSIGRQQVVTCVNESGLYHLIFKSRKKVAQDFRKWVTAEVLPSLRKTGGYAVGISKTETTISKKETVALPKPLTRAEQSMLATVDGWRNAYVSVMKDVDRSKHACDNVREAMIAVHKGLDPKFLRQKAMALLTLCEQSSDLSLAHYALHIRDVLAVSRSTCVQSYL